MLVLVLSLSAPVAMVLMHLTLQRTILSAGDPRARLKLVIQIVIGVTVFWGMVSAFMFRTLPAGLHFLNTAYVVFVSFGLGMCYFNVFALSETALRIRLLMNSYIAEKNNDDNWFPSVAEGYDATALIRSRIDRLLGMGAAREVSGKIVIVSFPLILTARFLHAISSAWKKLIFGTTPDSRTANVWRAL